MRRLVEPLIWFWLVPYFAVLRLNVPAGIGLSREFTNRSNAQLILALILLWPLILLAPRTGPLGDSIRAHTYIFALLAVMPAWWIVSTWLKGDRERKYAAAYQALPRWRRIAFGLTTLALMVSALMITRSHAVAGQGPKSPSDYATCDRAATEVTADACS